MGRWDFPDRRQLQIGFAIAGVALLLSASEVQSEPPHAIKIDGKFDDWANVPKHSDPANDEHDTSGWSRFYRPWQIEHADVDLLEFRLTHDETNLFAYFRSRGVIGRTQKEAPEKRGGRYHALFTIDVDNNDETGYWLHEGGYFPTSRGYDVNAELEWFNGEFNAAQYLNHGCKNRDELRQAFLDQSQGKYVERNDGPYPAGFMRIGPGTYRNYTQWAYHDDGTITFTQDRGPTVPGNITFALSADGHELEMGVPFKGFLVDQHGKPVIELGRTIDVSFSLEASGELAADPSHIWASDTALPINGYVLEKPSAQPPK
jgi:hypothetical protein